MDEVVCSVFFFFLSVTVLTEDISYSTWKAWFAQGNFTVRNLGTVFTLTAFVARKHGSLCITHVQQPNQ
jgi:succinate dehydrogenase hydrophobic anchor subunit